MNINSFSIFQRWIKRPQVLWEVCRTGFLNPTGWEEGREAQFPGDRLPILETISDFNPTNHILYVLKDAVAVILQQPWR